MATKKSGGSLVGRDVTFKYRGAKGARAPHGTVVGVVQGKGSKADPMLAIRPAKSSHHAGEPAVVHRRASNVTRRSK